MYKHVVTAIVTLLMVATTGWIAAQDLPGNPDRGEAIYKEQCLQCHGRLGDGQGPAARDLIVQPQDFHTLEARGRTDFELLIAVSNGVLFSPMHSWRGRLKDQEMLDVIQYIRALAPPRVTS